MKFETVSLDHTCQEMAHQLTNELSDEYNLYIQLRSEMRNPDQTQSDQDNNLFEVPLNDFDDISDKVAGGIRCKGQYSDISLKSLLELMQILESEIATTSFTDYIKLILSDHFDSICFCKKNIHLFASKYIDLGKQKYYGSL